MVSAENDKEVRFANARRRLRPNLSIDRATTRKINVRTDDAYAIAFGLRRSCICVLVHRLNIAVSIEEVHSNRWGRIDRH